MNRKVLSISKKEERYKLSSKALYATQYLVHSGYIEVLNDAFKIDENIKCDLNNCNCKLNSFTWVSHQRKLIWFEIPKSASRSIVRAMNFNGSYIDEIIGKLDHFDLEGVTLFFSKNQQYKYFLFYIRLYVANIYRRKFKSKREFQLFYGDKDEVLARYPDYFSFAVLREPLDRILSNYLMFTQKPKRIDKLKINFGTEDISSLNFNDFVYLTTQYHNHHWEEQIKYLPHNANKIKLLTTLDSISEDWKILHKKLGSTDDMPKLNFSHKTKAYSDYYDDDIRDMVSKIYSKDVELYKNIQNKYL